MRGEGEGEGWSGAGHADDQQEGEGEAGHLPGPRGVAAQPQVGLEHHEVVELDETVECEQPRREDGVEEAAAHDRAAHAVVLERDAPRGVAPAHARREDPAV